MRVLMWLLIIAALTARLAVAQPQPDTGTCNSAVVNASVDDRLAIVRACTAFVEQGSDDVAVVARIVRGEALLEMGDYENALIDFDSVLDDWSTIAPESLRKAIQAIVGASEAAEPEMSPLDALDWMLSFVHAYSARAYCALNDPERAAESAAMSSRAQFRMFQRLRTVEDVAEPGPEPFTPEDKLELRDRFVQGCPPSSPPPPAPIIVPVE